MKGANMMHTRLHKAALGLAIAAALALGAALAQPSINTSALAVSGGTLAGYVDGHSVGGTTGVCYENSIPISTTSYACFEEALKVSGLSDLVGGSKQITVLAPTDAAFRTLEGASGMAAFLQFMHSKSAMSSLERDSVVNGSYTVAELAAHANQLMASTTLTTTGGTPLAIAFGAVGYGTSSTTVDVGPSNAYD
ncbi:MAG: fasciclin domain-containing protein, partial [Deinococcales bacterium]